MNHQRRLIFAFVFLGVGFIATSATAKELPNVCWGPVVGLTSNNILRMQLVATNPRLSGRTIADNFCAFEVKVKVFTPDLLTTLYSTGATRVEVGRPLHFDYRATPGPPPAREEVIVRLSVEHKPVRGVQRALLPALCPLVGSLQVFDATTGDATGHFDIWDGSVCAGSDY